MDSITSLRDATREILHDQKDAMREVVRGLSVEALNWRPALHSDANSIAQMLSHALDAERFHASAAVGITFDRDRERHFHVADVTADDLLALIDRTDQQVNASLDDLTVDHLAQESTGFGGTRSGAWRLLHAIEHSREHIGQALLTRQLWDEDEQRR